MKARHPVRSEMKAIFKAETVLRDKQYKLRKKQRDLEKVVAQMNEEIEETQRDLQIEIEKLADSCNVAPSSQLDTVAIKWVSGPSATPIDFGKEDSSVSPPNGETKPEVQA